MNISEGFSCPILSNIAERIEIGHGSGGRMTTMLIHQVFRKYFDSDPLIKGDDSALLQIPHGFHKIAVTTDSHIVSPLFFPGGDIGKLSICGTVNDLLTAGAIPHAITVGFILEEGLPICDLEKILFSMRNAADEAGVMVVSGDTKVVEKGKGDGIFINTTGIGWVMDDFKPSGAYAKAGDAVLISGTIGDHGMAVICARGELGFSSSVESDVAPLTDLVGGLREERIAVHVLRDPTRGGVGTTLNEIARQSGVTITIDESILPIHPQTESLCQLLGFDPLYVANEGKMIVIVPDAEKERALSILRKSCYGKEAQIIGAVSAYRTAPVLMKTRYGTHRIIDDMPGEMLPRIC